ncbi:MAG: DUF2868 domain-containing protein [Myxococcales bacterium]|nr:DUF2868 domain-containing protein [Myxococcales bacterium]
MQHLSEVIDFEVLMERDADRAAQDGNTALIIRDRALGEQLPQGSPLTRLRYWLENRRRVEIDLPGESAANLISLLGWALLILGALAGASCGAALLAYDGKSPINVMAWLLYVAGIPFVFALFLILGLMMPRRFLSRAGPVQALLGTLIQPLLRRLPGGIRWTQSVFGRSSGIERWLLVGLTQVFTIGFLFAAIITLLVKVVITDLAFSWSTTLHLRNEQVAKVVQVVSSPWKGMVPLAVPDARAIEQSNYNRYIDDFTPNAPGDNAIQSSITHRSYRRRSSVDPVTSTRWWMFCAAAVVCYGLIPRFILLLLSMWCWQRTLAKWPDLKRADVSSLMQRLNNTHPEGVFTPRRTSDIVEPYSTPDPPVPSAKITPVSAEEPSGADTAEAQHQQPPLLTVVWGSAAADRQAAAAALMPPPQEVMSAGADLDLSAERKVLEHAANQQQSVQVLIPLTEPPVEDVLSFLRELVAVAPAVDIVPIERRENTWHHATIDNLWTRALARVQGVGVRQP